MLSPPGLFSITTAWPHLRWSFSANSRPPMSAPAPGPNGTMNFTGRVGQLCACAAVSVASAVPNSVAMATTTALNDMEFLGGFLDRGRTLSIFAVQHNAFCLILRSTRYERFTRVFDALWRLRLEGWLNLQS